MAAFSMATRPPGSGPDGIAVKATRARIARSPLIAAPLLFGIPVALGIVVSVVRLLGVRYPNLGWATTVNSDAEELYLGHTLYQNPAHGYTGQIYTPLFPTIASLFDRIYLWNGWPLLMVIGASVALVVLAARIAYTRDGPAPAMACLLGAAGVGTIAYWCVASVPLSLLDEARADQVAWAFALLGLIAVADLGPTPSRRRVVIAALLLSAALWTKQTTVGVVVPAVAWVIGLAAASVLNRKAAALFIAVIAGVNIGILVILNVLTHGWEFYINFEMATRQANEWPYLVNLEKGLQSNALAGVFVIVTWLASVVAASKMLRQRFRGATGGTAVGGLRRLLLASDPTGRRALLLGIYIVFGFALAAYFMRKQGTETNQMIGVAWALGLFAAVGWRVAQRHAGVAVAAGGCVALFFLATQIGAIRAVAADERVVVPKLETAYEWPSVPSELRLWAAHHTLYTALFADLNVPQGGPLYPNFYNFADLLASGNQPLYLVHALLSRRFEGTSFLPLEGDAYASGDGKWEENYLWKLDEVIAARYVAQPGLPEGVLGRRPGPEQAAWMRHCFGPFKAAGASFRIHHGGGFWCSFAPGELELVRAPVPLSEVVTTEAVSPSGTLAVSLEDQSSAQLGIVVEGGSGANWVARITPAPRRPHDLIVSSYLDGRLLGSALARASTQSNGRLAVRLGVTPVHDRPSVPIVVAPGVVALTIPAVKASMALLATHGVAVDLNRVRLEH
jgi:hypothetical protein